MNTESYILVEMAELREMRRLLYCFKWPEVSRLDITKIDYAIDLVDSWMGRSTNG